MWEYLQDKIGGVKWIERFDQLGAEGWELVAVTHDKIAIFKRRKH